MLGFIFLILAGVMISVQGVFNTRVSEKIGLWETVAVLHGLGLLLAVLLLPFVSHGDIKRAGDVNVIYFIGGILSVAIVYSVMQGFTALGPATSVAVLFIAQLGAATAIETFGLFGNAEVVLSWTKFSGIVLMIAGVMLASRTA